MQNYNLLKLLQMKTLIIIALTLIAVVAVQVYLSKVWFYRDPPRVPESTENSIIAPADGQVIYINDVKDQKVISKKLGSEINIEEISKSKTKVGDGYLIGIYMSPLDVHYNYAPIGGTVESIHHAQAKVNLPMVDIWEYIRLTYLRRVVDLFGKKYHLTNERNTIFIKGNITVAMVEIADKFVNKIKCFVKINDSIKIGQKIAFIERGSQVDLYIPKETQIKVKVGQQVYGGQTIIASYEAITKLKTK